mmetsp:Transcript_69363/g.110175  ORF Transcript_69363/g.110175 Transcript_69363/m.110175 type:complete len:112 (-) Transcript_69363:167-502(-)|eukprot:CAMPEP_0197054784 /NCGR_PEP_ID=MMETSP1384-20130603/49831_1 /TAXON_ID=29189 /ORGANISM="Ammonia sp." /LENGTH=111 /DNA_ID=CAMNT_0042488093 /DNA_START=108 /DNA_END=443 /DNA_ORIENTATION=+
MSRVALRALRPLQSRVVASRPARLQLIQRRKVGSNWTWDNIDPKLRWTNTKLARGDPATQMFIPLNNKYALMAQLKFMLPFYLTGIAIWYYIDATEPVWLDAELYTYVEKE